jgi:HlyD family secretion protein
MNTTPMKTATQQYDATGSKNAASWFVAAKNYIAAHKVIATIVALIVLYGGYYTYGVFTALSTATRYVTTTVATSTVVATLPETGQVNASQQISLSPKASGEVTGIYVKPGDQVYAGQVVAQIDATNAIQSLRNAQLALQNVELSYQQTTATSTLALNLIVAKNGAASSQIALQKAHDNVYASIASIYSDLGTIVSGLDSALHGSTVAGRTTQQNIDAYADLVLSHDDSISIYKNSAQTSYTAAYVAYNNGLAAYKATSSTISNDDLVVLAQSTYMSVQAVAEAVRNSHDFFDRVTADYSLYNFSTSSTLASLLLSLNTYTTTVSTDLDNALSDQSSIVSAEQSLAQAQNTLQVTEGGSNTLTIQSAALSLQQAKDSVTNAQTTLAGYTVTVPFAGTIAAVGAKRYDQVSSGTAVATLVTNQETANITVNEIDASKLKVGQKATLTFGALPNMSIAGTVASINSVGTVSQGVVSYSVVIGFDTPNVQVMPGMSVTADIIISIETGLVVPNSAVKASNGQSYVLTFIPPLAGSNSSVGAVSPVTPTRTNVVTGLTDNTNIVIESGLTANMQVVIKTIAGTAATAASTAAKSTSIFGGGAPGGNGSTRSILRTVGG